MSSSENKNFFNQCWHPSKIDKMIKFEQVSGIRDPNSKTSTPWVQKLDNGEILRSFQHSTTSQERNWSGTSQQKLQVFHKLTPWRHCDVKFDKKKGAFSIFLNEKRFWAQQNHAITKKLRIGLKLQSRPRPAKKKYNERRKLFATILLRLTAFNHLSNRLLVILARGDDRVLSSENLVERRRLGDAEQLQRVLDRHLERSRVISSGAGLYRWGGPRRYAPVEASPRLGPASL